MVKIPKEFGFKTESIIEVEKTVYGNLRLLKEQGQKLQRGFEKYCLSDDARDRDDMAETLNSRLNHFTQAFKDLMAFIKINNDSAYEGSLRYFIQYYETLNIEHTGNIKGALDLMKTRNDLVHDYFNIQKNNEMLLKGLENYGRGFEELSDSLWKYCQEKFPEYQLQENIKNILKQSKKKKR